MFKYIKIVFGGMLLIFAFLFILLACSTLFQGVLTTLGRIFVCIVAVSNFILTTEYFVDNLWTLKK